MLRLVMPYYCGNEQTSFSAEASELNRKLPTLHRAALPAVRLMPNSHRPPDATRRSCLCRVRRCELSLETVWQRLNSQLIDHPRRVDCETVGIPSLMSRKTLGILDGGRGGGVDRSWRRRGVKGVDKGGA